tara:strand:- start:1239 stop:1613 length:375 start_codon:yes stop_codon:yes gene_type:complete
MNKHAIYILFTYHFVVRTAANYLKEHDFYGIYYGDFYYFLDALMILAVGFYVYFKSDNHGYRNISALVGVCLLAICQMVNTGVQMYTGDEDKFIEYLPELLTAFIVLDLLRLLYLKILKKWLHG